MFSCPRASGLSVGQLRPVILTLFLAGHLPVPIVHSHESIGPQALSRHLALCHTRCAECPTHQPHVHVVPPAFLSGNGWRDTTGEDAPGPDGPKSCPLDTVQLDRTVAVQELMQAPTVAFRPVAATNAPRHFLETYSAACDLSGLWGVCRC